MYDGKGSFYLDKVRAGELWPGAQVAQSLAELLRCGVQVLGCNTHTHTSATTHSPLPSQRCVLTWEDLGVDQVLGTQWVAAAVNRLQPETVASCSVFTTSLNEALNNIVATPRGANKSLSHC